MANHNSTNTAEMGLQLFIGATQQQTLQPSASPTATKQKKKACAWTPAEDQILRESVEAHNGKKWKSIAQSVPDRTQAQCHQRWTKALAVENKRGTWTHDEDFKLRALRAQHGDNYKYIAKQMGTRTVKQCVERWKNNLDPSLNHSAFTADEDAWLKQLAEAYEGKWADIAREMPGRTEHMVKARVRAMQKERVLRGKVKRAARDESALASSSVAVKLEASTSPATATLEDDNNKRAKLGSATGLGLFKRMTRKLSIDPMSAFGNNTPTPVVEPLQSPSSSIPASTQSTTMEGDREIIKQLCAAKVRQQRRHDSDKRPSLLTAYSTERSNNDFLKAFDSSAMDSELDGASTAAVNDVLQRTRNQSANNGSIGSSMMSLGALAMESLNGSVGTFKMSSLSEEGMRDAMRDAEELGVAATVSQGSSTSFVRPPLTRTSLTDLAAAASQVEATNDYGSVVDDSDSFVRPPLTHTSLAGHDLEVYLNKMAKKNGKTNSPSQQRPGNNRGNGNRDLEVNNGGNSMYSNTHHASNPSVNFNNGNGSRPNMNNFNNGNGSRPNMKQLRLNRSSDSNNNIFSSVNGAAVATNSSQNFDLNWSSIGSFPNMGNNDASAVGVDERADAATGVGLLRNTSSTISMMSVDALSDRFLLSNIRA